MNKGNFIAPLSFSSERKIIPLSPKIQGTSIFFCTILAKSKGFDQS
jgi:hypothetical protein